MIVFQGQNLLSRIAYYIAHKYSIDAVFMQGPAYHHQPANEKDILSERCILLNHYSLSHLHLPDSFGHEIYRLQVYTVNRGHFYPGFQVSHDSLGVPFLGKMCSLSSLAALYPLPSLEHTAEYDPSISSWCSHHLYKPDSHKSEILGFARQILLNTTGDQHCAFQIFDWPIIMGFLPINKTQTILVYSSSDPEKIDKPLHPHFIRELQGLLKNTPLNVTSIDKIGDAVPLISYHLNSYRHGLNGLFGEAIHRTHPLAGQGMNMGIADALSLLQLSQQYKEPFHLIQMFEKQRWLSNAMTHNFCHQLSLQAARWWAPSLLRAFNRSKIFQEKFFSCTLQIHKKLELEIIS